MSNEKRKQYDRDRKKLERLNNTPYAQRVREAKRTDEAKEKRKIQRADPVKREKEKIYAREYRQREEVKLKNRARGAVKYALSQGIITRPESCQKCGAEDVKLKDGRSGLRADHHNGYNEEHKLDVLFICLKCDGQQLRKHYDLPC